VGGVGGGFDRRMKKKTTTLGCLHWKIALLGSEVKTENDVHVHQKENKLVRD
jgi:hypothetical protein